MLEHVRARRVFSIGFGGLYKYYERECYKLLEFLLLKK